MTKVNENLDFKMLMDKIKTYNNDKKQLEIITSAYNLAYSKHHGQYRKSGEAYIIHPLNVAYILTDIKADYETICAALLHDTIEDTDITLNDLERMFGHTVRMLVDGVTKINKLDLGADKDAEIATQRKILVGMTSDVRVIILKMADRLHNLRTLWALQEHRQKYNAKETLDILVPIAHRLGMYKMKSELEDLSLRYYKPDVYFGIVETLNKTKVERDAIVDDMLKSVSKLLTENGIKHEIKGRAKSIYSIYNKMDKGKSFSDIYDLNALRIFVDTVSECYQVLGIVHSKYTPKPKRFKDYIAMPKSNGYQSLHTTVFGNNGYLFEIQIRTYEMDQIAENGIASHWAYKEGINDGGSSFMDRKLEFFKSIIELQEDNDEHFIENVKQDIFENIIYVFTPNGSVIELPNGSTPIDFAYKVHTDVGNSTVGAIVNDNIVPLSYLLKTNDVVKINTSKSAHPNREWLNFVKTTQAKNKIKNYFNKIEKNVFLKKGEDLLKDELRRRKISITSFLTDDNISKLLSVYKLRDLDDLYINLGSNKLVIGSIINTIVKKELTREEIVLDKISNNKVSGGSVKRDIIVRGIDDVKVSIASCCDPIPGDEILGYITKGNGISVHRSTCPNIRNSYERLIDVSWNSETVKSYQVDLLITANSNKNLLTLIVGHTISSNIVINSINALSLDARYRLTVSVSNKQVLDKFIADLMSIDDVISVERLVK